MSAETGTGSAVWRALPPIAVDAIASFLGSLPFTHTPVVSLTVDGSESIESGQVLLVRSGLRSAMLFERYVKPQERRRVVGDGLAAFLCIDDRNLFAINTTRLADRIAAVAAAFVGDRDFRGVLPGVVFAGSHLRMPRPPTRPEFDAWARRLIASLLLLSRSIHNQSSASSGVSFTFAALTDLGAFFCPVALCGWLLEYPAVYDVCGPYDDVPLHSCVSDILSDLRCEEVLQRWGRGGNLVGAASREGTRIAQAWKSLQELTLHFSVPMHPGNCLGGELLTLVKAVYSAVISPHDARQLAVLSFSLPARLLGYVTGAGGVRYTGEDEAAGSVTRFQEHYYWSLARWKTNLRKALRPISDNILSVGRFASDKAFRLSAACLGAPVLPVPDYGHPGRWPGEVSQTCPQNSCAEVRFEVIGPVVLDAVAL